MPDTLDITVDRNSDVIDFAVFLEDAVNARTVLPKNKFDAKGNCSISPFVATPWFHLGIKMQAATPLAMVSASVKINKNAPTTPATSPQVVCSVPANAGGANTFFTGFQTIIPAAGIAPSAAPAPANNI
jgi:hypothetical protein